MKRVTLLMALAAVCAPGIDIPRIGFTRDANGQVTAVNGVAGNFVLAGTPAASAVAFTWNGTYGIRQTASTIEWWDASGKPLATLDSPAGDAVIGLGASTAWIYSKSAAALYRLDAGQWLLEPVPLSLSLPAEDVLALSANRGSITVALNRYGALFIATFDPVSGFRTSETPLSHTANAALFLTDGSLLAVDSSTIWLKRTDGSEWTTDIGIPLTALAWLGRDWIQISASDRQLALRLRPASDPALFTLPQMVSE